MLLCVGRGSSRASGATPAALSRRSRGRGAPTRAARPATRCAGTAGSGTAARPGRARREIPPSLPGAQRRAPPRPARTLVRSRARCCVETGRATRRAQAPAAVRRPRLCIRRGRPLRPPHRTARGSARPSWRRRRTTATFALRPSRGPRRRRRTRTSGSHRDRAFIASSAVVGRGRPPGPTFLDLEDTWWTRGPTSP